MCTNPGRTLPEVACVRIAKPELDDFAHGHSGSSWAAPIAGLSDGGRTPIRRFGPAFRTKPGAPAELTPRARAYAKISCLKCALRRNITAPDATPAQQTI